MKVIQENGLQLMARARETLRGAGVESAGVDAEQLLMHLSGASRTALYGPSLFIEPAQGDLYWSWVARRAKGEPLQYITGRAHFRKLMLQVGPGVLIPRPETEVLVDRALERISGLPNPLIVELGTGSGVVAISIASEFHGSHVIAGEKSPEALRWATANARQCGTTNVEILQSDLFDSLPAEHRGSVDLVVANLPYLDASEVEETFVEVKDHEPLEALLGGGTGSEICLRAADQSLTWLKPAGWLLMETSPRLAQDLAGQLQDNFFEVQVLQDLAGRDRIVEARAPSLS